ncbi:hypothetical protein [Bacteroides thetaiotaomicron]|uniref:hypothetical protein n=1 Tax=Bacteroides thetaiotaomicron TaxID=818 RepID=UPI0035685653
MTYSLIFGSTSIQMGELEAVDAVDSYKIYKNGECIATRDFSWCRLFGDVVDNKLKISLDDMMAVCIQNSIFECYMPSKMIFNQCKIIDDNTELWYDCIVITPTKKEEEMLLREPWLRKILFPESKCNPVKSILFKKNELIIEYLDPTIKLVAGGFTRKIIGNRGDEFSSLLKSLKKIDSQIDSSYNDGLDTDQQSQSYWMEEGLF